MMQQVTKTAREITKRNEEQQNVNNASESDDSDEEDDDDEIIGPLPPPDLGMYFKNYITINMIFLM